MNQTLRRIALAAALVAGGIGAAVVLVATGPEAPRGTSASRVALVETLTARAGVRRFHIDAQGVVVPDVEIALQSEVGGRIVEVHPRLKAGGVIEEGATLLRIDPVDYELAVAREETSLAQARAQLELEKGRRQVAQREWELFEGDLDAAGADSALALREPQLKSAEAAVAAAQARLRQARLNLARTQLRAPFDAYVVSESADIGQTVTPQMPVAQLVGTNRFLVRTSLPAEHLALLADPVRGGANAPVAVHYDLGGRRATWTGTIDRVLKDVNRTGQMAQVMVAIDDPLALGGGDGPALLLGSVVDVDLYSAAEHQVFALPREVLQSGDRLLIFADGELDIRDVVVAWREADEVFVTEGLREGERVIRSPLAAPVDGMPLATVSETALRAQAPQ